MKERKGIVFSISRENQPVDGCTISKEIVNREDYQIFYFSLAARTDISPEIYRQAKLIYVISGGLHLSGPRENIALSRGQAVVAESGIPVGMKVGMKSPDFRRGRQNGLPLVRFQVWQGTAVSFFCFISVSVFSRRKGPPKFQRIPASQDQSLRNSPPLLRSRSA
jgi:hypothetical protein